MAKSYILVEVDTRLVGLVRKELHKISGVGSGVVWHPDRDYYYGEEPPWRSGKPRTQPTQYQKDYNTVCSLLADAIARSRENQSRLLGVLRKTRLL